ncbi:PTS sugar transporter subunit IIA [Aurantiacibacter sp. D1-12]|uniref:PTS sugar transporter subunit IIA n=1 Tax=Aurantiacibacter sp. D1-12 TaxID=2993658 RepID=UPI00237CC1CA|nr:PTS sugar transporter subunit IIA [Aurantiacibacter sp. D1-12]MDE1468121.1 PTS sugar transporter subunit IIA [Aurantiacibacter sp. D1-12]
MNSNFVLKPESVALTSAETKREILELVAQTFAKAWDLDASLVLEHLEERENLGSTGFGRGVAIPHARFPGINRPIATVIKLEKPVDFNAADGLPVDLVFGLLSPESCGATHLHALAAVSRLMRDERMHDALSDAPTAEALYSLVNNVTDRDAA